MLQFTVVNRVYLLTSNISGPMGLVQYSILALANLPERKFFLEENTGSMDHTPWGASKLLQILLLGKLAMLCCLRDKCSLLVACAIGMRKKRQQCRG